MSVAPGEKKKTVAVIGAGIFGCTTAIELSTAGFSVTLFDKASDIMQAASGINQYRMHRGYHYPRSPETIRSSMEATPLFEEVFKDAIMTHVPHYYAIAKEGSKVSGEVYLEVLRTHGLPFEIETLPQVNADAVDVVVRATEHLYDPAKLRELVRERLIDAGVTLMLNREVHVDELHEYDFVVVATYAHFNSALKERTDAHRDYQYEVCEKLVVEMPDELKGMSLVVMDGPFMCFDPLGDTGYSVMGHVDHAIHQRSFGTYAQVPEYLVPLLNKGIIANPEYTNFEKFIASGTHFVPALAHARHVGSMYTIRTVLPKVDATDERPTIIESLDHRVFTIYSGKVGNSVQAARDVVAMITASLA
jgi:hypothetical protein